LKQSNEFYQIIGSVAMTISDVDLSVINNAQLSVKYRVDRVACGSVH